jgi:hypothetical protein
VGCRNVLAETKKNNSWKGLARLNPSASAEQTNHQRKPKAAIRKYNEIKKCFIMQGNTRTERGELTKLSTCGILKNMMLAESKNNSCWKGLARLNLSTCAEQTKAEESNSSKQKKNKYLRLTQNFILPCRVWGQGNLLLL